MLAVHAEGLRYAYGKQTVLHDIDLQVNRGAVFALVGPNGGGKSTLLSLLSTARRPSHGTLTVLGHKLPENVEAARQHLGVVFQSPAIDGLLTVKENLSLHARLFSNTKIDLAQVLAYAGLAELANQRAHRLSGGQKRRVELAKVLLRQPHLVLLDEPSTGLDPEAKRLFWKAVLEYRSAANATIIVATHDDEEAAHSQQLAFVVGGRLLHKNDTHTLLRTHTEPTLEIATRDLSAATEWFSRRGATLQTTAVGVRAVHPLAKEWLNDVAQLPFVEEVTLRRPSLSSVFAKLTGEVLQ